MRKKMVKEDSLVAESIISNFKYSHQPENANKYSYHWESL